MTFEQKLVCALAAFAVSEQGAMIPADLDYIESWLQAYRHATGAYCDGNAAETRKGFGYLKSLVRGNHPKNTFLVAYTAVSRSCPSGPQVKRSGATVHQLRKRA